jgi:hypothetical protein
VITHRQKFLIHHYPRAAGISDATYRRVLATCAGVRSAADDAFAQDGFERCMAAFETMLAERVAQGIVQSPVGRDRHILSLSYWRRRLPHDGCANSRQIRRLRQLWDLLSDVLPSEDRSHEYLLRIATRAIGKAAPPDMTQWSATEAGWVMDALTDRLAYAYRTTDRHENRTDTPGLHRVEFVPDQAAVPF